MQSTVLVVAAIVVEQSGAWIDCGGGRRVRCDHRAATRRILAALARACIESPGRPVDVAVLVAAGWPGERILPAAAKNRLRVAVAWLRKNALGGALVFAVDGYALDPHVVVVRREIQRDSGIHRHL